jgi:hypothetical protein
MKIPFMIKTVEGSTFILDLAYVEGAWTRAGKTCQLNTVKREYTVDEDINDLHLRMIVTLKSYTTPEGKP